MASPSDRAGSETDWESRYLAGDTPWDKGAAHPALVRWLNEHPLTGRILVPGCGLGHDVRAISTPQNEVIGLDLAPSALAAAKKFPRVAGEQYLSGDFFAPPAGWEGAFDGIFEHTCFCAIDPSRRADYARAAATLLKSGGLLLAIFFMNPDHDEPGPPFGSTTAELDNLFGAHFQLLHEEKSFPTYQGREERELLRLLRRI